jgi:membrane carboxypeptidase/penicillin-binding protein PbpC
LGGGEVSLLDLTSAYGVFANDGMRNPYRSILRIEDSKGNVLESVPEITYPTQVLQPEISRQISSILSDTNARMDSLKAIGESVGRPVAIKTGTTNDYRDVWIEGYTPNLVVGAWAGKNDNTPMSHNVAGLIISPLWGAFMSQVIKDYPREDFTEAPPPLTDNKPVLRGVWQGGSSYWKDSISGKLATDQTPPETRQEVVFPSVHTILNWLNKDDPRGPVPADPKSDSQYDNWEYGVRKWFTEYKTTHPEFKENVSEPMPLGTDDVHSVDKAPRISFISPFPNAVMGEKDNLIIHLQISGAYPAKKTEVYLNGRYVLTSERDPLNISFFPSDVGNLNGNNVLSVTVYDAVFNRGLATTTFSINK